MKNEMLTLDQVNKNYKRRSNIAFKILAVFFVLYGIILISYCFFCSIYIRAEVIGCSMQPLFNENLSYGEDYESSIYRDVVYANRFKRGTNGDIVLVNRPNDIVIKRIIAVGGQKITLRKESDELYHYYISNDVNSIGEILEENYISNENRLYMNYSYYVEFLLSTGAEENSEYLNCEASIVVPEDKIFILGDNRRVSQDGHSYGFINENDIIGKVEFFHYYNENLIGFLWNKVSSVF